jgi:hypothetical protein
MRSPVSAPSRQPVDPETPVGVEHHLDDTGVFQKPGNGRAERGAQHPRAPREPFRIVMRSRHLIPNFTGETRRSQARG